MRKDERLISLYRQMYEHTKAECDRSCLARRAGTDGCCNGMYCEMAMEWAKQRWGVRLTPTENPRLPLMGPSGCTAGPHLRPLCTVHQCCIASLGFKKDDPVWTERYFELRDAINRYEDPLEMEEH